MKVVKFMNALLSEVHQNSMLYGTADKDDNSGEYVSLAEYQELNQQYQELADNSKISILSLVEQRSQLRELLKRWNEIAPELFNTYGIIRNRYKTPELTQLIQDTQEVVG